MEVVKLIVSNKLTRNFINIFGILLFYMIL